MQRAIIFVEASTIPNIFLKDFSKECLSTQFSFISFSSETKIAMSHDIAISKVVKPWPLVSIEVTNEPSPKVLNPPHIKSQVLRATIWIKENTQCFFQVKTDIKSKSIVDFKGNLIGRNKCSDGVL